MTTVLSVGINSAKTTVTSTKAAAQLTKSIGSAKSALMISKKCLDLKLNNNYYEAACRAASYFLNY